MDRHDSPGATAEDTARNHVADLEVAGQFGVQFLSYWHDAERGVVFCLAQAPEADAMARAHETAHGDVAAEIIEVSESDVVRFLGKVQDPADADAATSAFRIIGFTDLVGSTELLDRLGQSEYMVLLTEHDLTIRQALLKWQGREVKHTGDGFMVVFTEVEQALGWALDVRLAFDQRSDLDVRLGMAAGEPVDHDGDVFGAAVTMASRICSAARPENVLVSQEIRDLGVAAGYRFDDGHTAALKGFSKPARLFELIGPSDGSPAEDGD